MGDRRQLEAAAGLPRDAGAGDRAERGAGGTDERLTDDDLREKGVAGRLSSDSLMGSAHAPLPVAHDGTIASWCCLVADMGMDGSSEKTR